MELAYRMPNESFLTKVSKAKDDTYDRMLLSLQNVKLEFLKQTLREKGIEYNDSITDLKELKKQVINSLPTDIRKEIQESLSSFSLKLDDTVKELREGSTSKLHDLMKYIANGTKNTSKAAVLAMATRSVIKFAPSLQLKAIAGVAITGGAIYKGSKTYIENRRKERTKAYDQILMELETSKDNNGNIIDTRFSEHMQKEIYDFLKDNNIQVKEGDYLNLRETMYSLDNKNKRKLLNFINGFKGNQIDIDKKVKEYEKSTLESLKDDFAKPMVSTLTKTLGIATAINAVNPAITASLINGSTLGTLIGKLTNNKTIGWIAGGAGTALTAAGGIFGIGEGIFATENIVAAALIGSISGVAYIAGKKVFKGVKGTKENIDRMDEQRKIKRKDRELYKNDKVPEKELMIISIMNEYMRQEGINVPNDGKSAQDFKEAVEKLNQEQKIKVMKALKELEKASIDDRQTGVDKLKKIGNALFWTGAIGLAGVRSV